MPHLHLDAERPEGAHERKNLSKTMMMVMAVVLHNIPEGMAVGVVFAGIQAGQSDITAAGAYTLALGIAIQNFPEGAIISMPLRSAGLSKGKAFLYGFLSGVVGAGGSGGDSSGDRADYAGIALSSGIRSGGHALCGSGGTDSGIGGGRAFQRGDSVFCGGICDNDDTGCSSGLTEGMERDEKDMDYEQDYIMRLIKDMARMIARLLLGKDSPAYELPEEEEEDSGADAAYRELARLIDEGRINEAENRLCDYLDQGSGSREELAAALGFYDHLSGCSEDFLEEHDYSREEIYDGLRELAARFGVTGLDIRM